MVQKQKKAKFAKPIEIIGKTPYAGSGPRGVDVYTRLLAETLSKHLPHNQLRVSRDRASAKQVGLAHYTFFDPFFLTLWGKTPSNSPYVVTVHDLIPLRFSAHFPKGIRGTLKWWLQKQALKKAAGIITDSKASKTDIVEYTHFPKEHIHVIPLAAGHTVATVALCKTVKAEYKLPDRFVLYVGDINWNKNIPGLIEAFTKAAGERTHLILVGKAFVSSPNTPESLAIEDAIKKSSASAHIHKLGFIPGHHLSALYRLATLYVQPSWYEGFGFPVIEALTQGTPVLSSNQGSLPEVGGDCVHYFNPNNQTDFVSQLKTLLTDSKLRTEYSAKGLVWVKKFSWKNVAHETLAVYEKYLQ
jgi:glycosyltransferase involved in cell wall biosynthesis